MHFPSTTSNCERILDFFICSLPPATRNLNLPPLLRAFFLNSPHFHFCFWTFRCPFSEEHLQQKIPELEKSLTLIRNLQKKKEAAENGDGDSKGIVRYSLTDNIFAKAELDYRSDVVNLWLGANVMLEFTYDEAVEFLSKNKATATKQLEEVQDDLAFVRDQVVTSEVSISRIYNWDVRRKKRTEDKDPGIAK